MHVETVTLGGGSVGPVHPETVELSVADVVDEDVPDVSGPVSARVQLEAHPRRAVVDLVEQFEVHP